MATVVKDSKREKVVVTRKFGDGTDKNKIFVSTTIIKGGKTVLEQFRVPVDTEVDIPVEVIAHLKERGIPMEADGSLRIAKEFTVEKV